MDIPIGNSPALGGGRGGERGAIVGRRVELLGSSVVVVVPRWNAAGNRPEESHRRPDDCVAGGRRYGGRIGNRKGGSRMGNVDGGERRKGPQRRCQDAKARTMVMGWSDGKTARDGTTPWKGWRAAWKVGHASGRAHPRRTRTERGVGGPPRSPAPTAERVSDGRCVGGDPRVLPTTAEMPKSPPPWCPGFAELRRRGAVSRRQRYIMDVKDRYRQEEKRKRKKRGRA